jgi:adhesin/invasin
VVRLTDSTGRALADVPVSWTALDGGTIEPAAPRTDTLGEVRARWTLAARSGRQRVRVQAGSGRGMTPLIVTATALAGAAHTAAVTKGDAQKGTVNAALERPVVVQVLDRGGNPVAGARVSAHVEGGTLADSVLTTDSGGTAAVRWTLGRTAGAQHMTIRVDGIETPLHVAATARPGRPANVELAPRGGGGSRWKGGPVTATVTDVYGNPVPDVPVVFRTKAGSVSPSRVASDDKGQASARWSPSRTAAEPSLVASVRDGEVKATLTVEGSKKRGG